MPHIINNKNELVSEVRASVPPAREGPGGRVGLQAGKRAVEHWGEPAVEGRGLGPGGAGEQALPAWAAERAQAQQSGRRLETNVTLAQTCNIEKRNPWKNCSFTQAKSDIVWV